MSNSTHPKYTRGLLGLTLCLAAVNLAHAQSFMGLGDLAGGLIDSRALGISGDGSTVVGTSSAVGINPDGYQAFAWKNGVISPLNFGTYGTANAASYDGSIITGFGNGLVAKKSVDGVVSTLNRPFGSSANDVSADGSVIVGYQSSNGTGQSGSAYRLDTGWGTATQFPSIWSSAEAVSADGSVVVGYGTSLAGFWSFRWANGVVTDLGKLTGGAYGSMAVGISADASTILGWSYSSNGKEAFRLRDGTLSALGDFDFNIFESQASDASGDGSVIVGFGTDSTGRKASIWLGDGPILNLQEFASSQPGLTSALEGWNLLEATAISDNGRFIAGFGTNPLGQREAFLLELAPIPEPSTYAAIIGAASLGLAILRRRRAVDVKPVEN